ncbi:hypothetical protein MTR67_010378 [Solanum verrucosum]|uniref:Uncharacterized protein n=1 Tax=Solanum verrucosum TaxID=315347 RepID=A0AAF0Q5X8_SOLVR|nr:hypothetical protein MTR67_010378 [Solanum verrucosum]
MRQSIRSSSSFPISRWPQPVDQWISFDHWLKVSWRTSSISSSPPTK